MLKFNKPLNEVIEELNKVEVKIDSDSANKIIDNLYSKMSNKYTKKEIAVVLNTLLKHIRNETVINEKIEIPNIFTKISVYNRKNGNQIVILGKESLKIKNNLECYVDDVLE